MTAMDWQSYVFICNHFVLDNVGGFDRFPPHLLTDKNVSRAKTVDTLFNLELHIKSNDCPDD